MTVLNGSGRVLGRARTWPRPSPGSGYRASVGGNADELRLHLERGLLRARPTATRPRRSQALLGPTRRRARRSSRARPAATRWWWSPAPTSRGRWRPRRRPRRAPPASTIDTTSLVDGAAQRAADVGIPGDGAAEGAARLTPCGSCAPYRINAGSGTGAAGDQDRVRDRATTSTGASTMTTMKNPPIVEGETGSYDSGGRKYLTYYDGRNLQRLAFRKGNVTLLDLEHASRTTSAPRRSRRSRSRCVR